MIRCLDLTRTHHSARMASLRGPKLALLASGGLCSLAVFYVHYGQEQDRVAMHQNVLRDIALERAEQQALALSQQRDAGSPGGGS